MDVSNSCGRCRNRTLAHAATLRAGPIGRCLVLCWDADSRPWIREHLSLSIFLCCRSFSISGERRFNCPCRGGTKPAPACGMDGIACDTFLAYLSPAEHLSGSLYAVAQHIA